jgi:hypothetical protein
MEDGFLKELRKQEDDKSQKVESERKAKERFDKIRLER